MSIYMHAYRLHIVNDAINLVSSDGVTGHHLQYNKSHNNHDDRISMTCCGEREALNFGLKLKPSHSPQPHDVGACVLDARHLPSFPRIFLCSSPRRNIQTPSATCLFLHTPYRKSLSNTNSTL